jgi:hypothetical protein
MRPLLVLDAVDDDVPGALPRARRPMMRPIDALGRRTIVIVSPLNVGVVADFDPRPARSVHLTEVAHDFDAVTGCDLDNEVPVFPAARVLCRKHAADGSADIDFLIALESAARELLLILLELRDVARPRSAGRSCGDGGTASVGRSSRAVNAVSMMTMPMMPVVTIAVRSRRHLGHRGYCAIASDIRTSAIAFIFKVLPQSVRLPAFPFARAAAIATSR